MIGRCSLVQISSGSLISGTIFLIRPRKRRVLHAEGPLKDNPSSMPSSANVSFVIKTVIDIIGNENSLAGRSSAMKSKAKYTFGNTNYCGSLQSRWVPERTLGYFPCYVNLLPVWFRNPMFLFAKTDVGAPQGTNDCARPGWPFLFMLDLKYTVESSRLPCRECKVRNQAVSIKHCAEPRQDGHPSREKHDTDKKEVGQSRF